MPAYSDVVQEEEEGADTQFHIDMDEDDDDVLDESLDTCQLLDHNTHRSVSNVITRQFNTSTYNCVYA